MATDNKYGLYKLGLVLDKTKSWIDSLKEVVQDPTVVTVNIVNDYIESENFCIEYIDLNDNLCSEEYAKGFRFKTPFKNKRDEVIYGFFKKNDKGDGYVGVRWSSSQHRRMKKMQDIGLILPDSWEKLRSFCSNNDLEDYGDYLLLPEEYYNGAGHKQFKGEIPVTKETAKFAVIRTTLQDKNGNPVIGWFTMNKKKWSGLDWGTEDDFEKAQDIRETKRLGRFLFKDMESLNKFISEIYDLLIPEPWDYHSEEPSGRQHPILCSYIEHELDRLFYEREKGKEDAIIYNDKQTEIFYSTNLLTKYGQDFRILGILDARKQYIEKYILAPDVTVLAQHGFSTKCEPAAPEFFKKIEEIIYHSEWDIAFNLQKDAHILEDRNCRIPKKYANLKTHEIGQKLQNAITFAQNMAKRNFRVIIPKYDPARKKIQLLMPIYFECRYTPEPDVALVLTPQETLLENGEVFHSYKPETILEVSHAYNDARLIAEPAEPWLAQSAVIKKKSKKVSE